MSALLVGLYCFFIGAVLINCSYYAYFSRYWLSKPKAQALNQQQLKGVSIICCIQNEAENLPQLFKKLSSQQYPCFEILLVNDHSTDDSLSLIRDFASKNKAVRLIDLIAETGKKAGITKAINVATYDKLLILDADCLPASDNWILEMTSRLTDTQQLVLGYGGYFSIKNSWLNKLIRFETLFTAMQYFAYAKNKNAYMGVGRNLAYTKSLFKSGNGFEKHKHHKAGDDDLFVNQNATPANVSLCVSPQAFTYSYPKESWKSWFVQKRRHIGASHLYKKKHQIQLGIFYASQFLVFSTSLFLLSANAFSLSILTLLLLREFFAGIVLFKTASRLFEKELIPYILILEPFMVSMQMLIFISTVLVKPKRWN